MEVLKVNLTGLARYRGREGHYSFLLHRITGLGVLLFLIIHILDTSTVYFYPELYEHAIEIYRSTPFIIGEIILVFSVIYHGINGLRIALLDLYFTDKWTITTQRKAAKWTFILSVILWLPAAFWMGRNLLIHNFGW
jgi:succinate dehydrogenase / fumarate reductase, cytochrome b subunit